MRSESRYDVLAVIDHYLPGRLSGGPVTTLTNMVNRLHQIGFLVVTLDHDLSGISYSQIPRGLPIPIGREDVVYLPKAEFTPKTLRNILYQHSIPTLYLNSFFSTTTIRTLLHHRLHPFDADVILAPRGEFSPGAYNLKRLKKSIYVQLFHGLGLARRVTFQASSDMEAADISAVLGNVDIVVAPDVPAASDSLLARPSTAEPGFVFLSRIVPKKNLIYALERIASADIPLTLDIYGPIEDQEYWNRCKEKIEQMPSYIKINYCGLVAHDEVQSTFSGYDAFLFPTLGENYGHVIYEALSAGCRVILSDQTPWQDLTEEGVGWVVPLDQPDHFEQALSTVRAESPADRELSRERCWAYARRIADAPEVLAANLKLLTRLQ